MIFRYPLDYTNHLYRQSKDLKSLFLSGITRRVAISFISIFSSIYIYQLMVNNGYGVKYGLAGALLFYFLIFAAKFPTIIFAENLSQKIGFKRVIRLSLIPFIFFILLLILSKNYLYLFIPASVLWGIHAGFFWWGYHGYFVKSGDKRHYAQSIAEFGLLDTLAVIFTPILGALIVRYLGFDYLFFLSGLFGILSIITLGKDHEKKQRKDVELEKVFDLIYKHKSISVSYVGDAGSATISAIIWPLFLFTYFRGVMPLGFIVSASAVTSAIYGIILGRWVDRHGERTVIGIGSPMTMISWLLRFFADSFTIFILSDSIWHFGQRMIGLPLNALTYRKAKDGGVGAAILFREINLFFGEIASIIVITVLVLYGTELRYMFLVGIIFSSLPLVSIVKKRFRDE